MSQVWQYISPQVLPPFHRKRSGLTAQTARVQRLSSTPAAPQPVVTRLGLGLGEGHRHHRQVGHALKTFTAAAISISNTIKVSLKAATRSPPLALGLGMGMGTGTTAGSGRLSASKLRSTRACARSMRAASCRTPSAPPGRALPGENCGRGVGWRD